MFTALLAAALGAGAFLRAPEAAALDNGLAKTPPMGWNSWNAFAGDIDETKIKLIADVLVSSGMKDAGYVYLNLDDNWMANPARDGSGNLRPDAKRFPSGMKALADYIHGKGLKFGIYGDRGSMTCMNVPQSGSYGHEEADAKTFASWEVDYFKNDNCNPVGDMQRDYQTMQKALASSGRAIVYNVCTPVGYQDWMPATGNSWRISGDIVDKWDNGSNFYKGIINLIDANASLASHAGPGAWNDPDMLEIGNGGCTTEEYRTQMSMWSIMAAPLLAGNDIRNMSQATKDILLNTEVIAIDQDAAGIQGTRVSASGGLEVWSKPLGSATGSAKAVAFLNRNGSAATISVDFSKVGLSGSVRVRDLWAKADRGSFTGSYSATSVPSHGTAMFKFETGPATGGTGGTSGVGGETSRGGAGGVGGALGSGGTSAQGGVGGARGGASSGGGGGALSAGGASALGGAASSGASSLGGSATASGGTTALAGATSGGVTANGGKNDGSGGRGLPSAGGNAGAAGGAAPGTNESDSSGCGCRMDSSASLSPISTLLTALTLAVSLLRRRRRARQA